MYERTSTEIKDSVKMIDREEEPEQRQQSLPNFRHRPRRLQFITQSGEFPDFPSEAREIWESIKLLPRVRWEGVSQCPPDVFFGQIRSFLSSPHCCFPGEENQKNRLVDGERVQQQPGKPASIESQPPSRLSPISVYSHSKNPIVKPDVVPSLTPQKTYTSNQVRPFSRAIQKQPKPQREKFHRTDCERRAAKPAPQSTPQAASFPDLTGDTSVRNFLSFK
eukprot:gene5349-2425_t